MTAQAEQVKPWSRTRATIWCIVFTLLVCSMAFVIDAPFGRLCLLVSLLLAAVLLMFTFKPQWYLIAVIVAVLSIGIIGHVVATHNAAHKGNGVSVVDG